MDIEKEIFKRAKADEEALLSYGFIKKENEYYYSKVFLKHFRADVTINKKGLVTGKVIDLDFEDLYIALRAENQVGEFVNNVREEYQNILKDILKQCFKKLYFMTDQANRIADRIIKKYHNKPEFLWDKFPEYGVFRNSHSNKWYALIINIDRSKVEKGKTGEVEILNLKLPKDKITSLLGGKGFYPSYHMNKENWVTILLDDTLSDDKIMEYVNISWKLNT